jgi:hypothetical protein
MREKILGCQRAYMIAKTPCYKEAFIVNEDGTITREKGWHSYIESQEKKGKFYVNNNAFYKGI